MAGAPQLATAATSACRAERIDTPRQTSDIQAERALALVALGPSRPPPVPAKGTKGPRPAGDWMLESEAGDLADRNLHRAPLVGRDSGGRRSMWSGWGRFHKLLGRWTSNPSLAGKSDLDGLRGTSHGAHKPTEEAHEHCGYIPQGRGYGLRCVGASCLEAREPEEVRRVPHSRGG